MKSLNRRFVRSETNNYLSDPDAITQIISAFVLQLTTYFRTPIAAALYRLVARLIDLVNDQWQLAVGHWQLASYLRRRLSSWPGHNPSGRIRWGATQHRTRLLMPLIANKLKTISARSWPKGNRWQRICTRCWSQEEKGIGNLVVNRNRNRNRQRNHSRSPLNEYAKAGQTVNKIKIKTHLSTRMAQTEAVRPSIRCRLWTNVGLPAMLLMPRVWPKGKRSQKRVKLLFFQIKRRAG